MVTKSLIKAFLVVLVMANIWAQNMSSDPKDNVIANILSPAPDRTGVVVSVLQTAECVPFYTATLELHEFQNGRWQTVDIMRTNLGSMRSIKINGQTLPARKDYKFGNVQLGSEGRVFRLMVSSASLVSENGCTVGPQVSRPYTHLEIAYMVWGQPEQWPDDLYLGPASQITIPKPGVMRFNTQTQNPTVITVYQPAGWDFVRQQSVTIKEGWNEFDLQLGGFRKEVGEIHLYMLDLKSGKSISIAGSVTPDFFE